MIYDELEQYCRIPKSSDAYASEEKVSQNALKLCHWSKKSYHIYFFACCATGKTKNFFATYNTWTIGKLHYKKENKVSDIFFQRYVGDLLSPAETILVSLFQIAAHLFCTYRTDRCAASRYIMTARGQ